MSDPLKPARHPSAIVRAHHYVDKLFARWAGFSFRHPWLIIFCWIAIVGGFSTQLGKIEVETSAESFVHEDDPARIAYNHFRYQFGRDERILVMVESPTGDVFNLPFLNKLQALHEDLETQVPKVVAVDSLINARQTRGEADELIVEDFLEDWPQDEADVAVLKARALDNPIYINQFLSPDSRYAVLLILNETYSSEGLEPVDALAGFDDLAAFDDPDTLAHKSPDDHPPFLNGRENTAIVMATQDVIAKHQADDFIISVAGSPFMVDQLSRMLMTDMARFMLLSIVLIMTLLAFAYRRAVMVFLPMGVAVLAMTTTMGTMGLIGIPLDGAVQIMPSFLITVGVASSVHIFTIFFQAMNRGANKPQALTYALEHSGTAILMTGITTLIGLASFMVSDVKPVANFGLITPVGIANTLFAALTLLPALIAVTPINTDKSQREHKHRINQRILTFCSELAIRNPWKVIGVWVSLVVISIAFALQMTVSHAPIKWFPEEHPLRIANQMLNENLGGSMFMEVLIDTGKENGVQDPELLNRIDALTQAMIDVRTENIHIGKITSIVDIVKETNQALHGNDPAFYSIPNDRALVAQELLLFENSGSDDLKQIVDSQFSKTRMTVKIPFIDAVYYPPLQDKLEPLMRDMIGDKAQVSSTGLLVMTAKTIYNLIISMINSYLLSITLISLLMMLFLGSVRVGLLSMFSNITPIAITLGFMVLMNVPLDAFTLLIGSIALGLAVDDTIHFMNNFIRYMNRYNDPERAIRETLATAGEAMWFTSLTLSASFLVYLFADMTNLYNFGLLTAFCILTALLADILMNPAIMVLYGRHKLRRHQAITE